MESPYGEVSCMKSETELWDAQPEDVADCSDYEPKEGNKQSTVL